MNTQQVDVKVQVEMLSPVFKEQTVSHMSPNLPQHPIYREFDFNYVRLGIVSLKDSRVSIDKSGSIVLKTEDAKKLGLMVGDILTITLVKDAQK